ncbi:MAG: PH domain-containing protein [Saprospiraceae bacterium]|jgi:putative membrane protein|nr:PH domain-containing protein [Saprospiraceae bacterium]
MKKSNYDFSEPTRQSYAAIIMILFKTGYVIIRQIFPVIVIFLIGGSKYKSDYLVWFLVAISALTMIYSIINFFKTYFIIKGDELVLHTGIFNKKKLSIPFERIQTVNFEQNIMHQLFSVLRMKLDTAGSEKNEFEFHAIESEKAYALRDLIMSGKKNQKSKTVNSINAENKVIYESILELSPLDLLKVGLTENHIRSGGLVFLFFFWIYQNLQEVGVNVDDYSQEIPDWQPGLYSILTLIFILLIISILISLVRTVIKNYDLKFLRSAKGFKVVSGLFTKKEISALDHKIQYISWSDNILKKWIGFKDLFLNQASSNELTAKQNIHIPGCNTNHIHLVTTSLFGQIDFDNIFMHPIDKKYFSRFTLILSIIITILSGVAAIVNYQSNIIFIIGAGIYFIITRYFKFRKKAYGYNDELIYIKGGIFGDKEEVLQMFKIQALKIHQTPYQTRHQLADITLHTASGKIKIPYISLSSCHYMVDLLLYKAESDTRKWM